MEFVSDSTGGFGIVCFACGSTVDPASARHLLAGHPVCPACWAHAQRALDPKRGSARGLEPPRDNEPWDDLDIQLTLMIAESMLGGDDEAEGLS